MWLSLGPDVPILTCGQKGWLWLGTCSEGKLAETWDLGPGCKKACHSCASTLSNSGRQKEQEGPPLAFLNPHSATVRALWANGNVKKVIVSTCECVVVSQSAIHHKHRNHTSAVLGTSVKQMQLLYAWHGLRASA